MKNENRKIFGEGYRPKATAVDMREFLDSPVWTDWKDFLEGRLAGLRDQLESIDAKGISYTQGRAAEVRGFLAVPGAMLDELLEIARRDKGEK